MQYYSLNLNYNVYLPEIFYLQIILFLKECFLEKCRIFLFQFHDGFLQNLNSWSFLVMVTGGLCDRGLFDFDPRCSRFLKKKYFELHSFQTNVYFCLFKIKISRYNKNS